VIYANVSRGELLHDLAECEADIVLCRKCLSLGVTHHSDGFPVRERIKGNEKIIALIRAELNRRGAEEERIAGATT
jgi:hypothetical protein